MRVLWETTDTGGILLKLSGEHEEDFKMLGLLINRGIPKEFDCDSYGPEGVRSTEAIIEWGPKPAKIFT